MPAKLQSKTPIPPVMTRDISAPPGVRLIYKPELLERTGRTFPTIWQWMRDGKFPRARDVNGRPAWIEAEIDAWVAALPIRKLKGDGEEAGRLPNNRDSK